MSVAVVQLSITVCFHNKSIGPFTQQQLLWVDEAAATQDTRYSLLGSAPSPHCTGLYCSGQQSIFFLRLWLFSTCMPLLPPGSKQLHLLLLLALTVMAVNCATAAPIAIGTPLDHALKAVEPDLVSVAVLASVSVGAAGAAHL